MVSDSKEITEMSRGFVKLKRSADTLELLKYPNAFALATLIALRANRRGADFSAFNLEPGEALIGDYESCGLTRGQYRWAKLILERGQFATFKKPSNDHQTTTNKNIKEINININKRSADAESKKDSGPLSHQQGYKPPKAQWDDLRGKIKKIGG
jgi:hypothetical protein